MLHKIIISALLLVLTSCSNQLKFKGELVYPPVATMQLGPSLFLSEIDLSKVGVSEGTPVTVTINGKSKDLRIYNSFGESSKIGIHKKYLSFFGISYHDNIQIIIVKANNSKLTPKPIKFSVENYHGDLNKWEGFAFGAPHGDCDNETGSVVKIVAKNYGIPATAAYGCRLSYRGIWYDCNRPLMKEARKNGRGVIPERLWNKRAEEKYHVFQDSVWANSKLKHGKRFKLFTSFHGHDLTVKLKDGRKIQRPVIEGMGVGFTKNELRKIKKFYYRNRNNYYKNALDLYFGNLPEDLVYEYQGIKLSFFYSGLGSRTYGSLRSDLCEHVLHFETPNSMRINPEVQPTTAKLLNDLYVFVKDSIFAQQKQNNRIAVNYTAPKNIGRKIKLKGGKFLFGAPKGFGWASEGPQHTVELSPFAIDIYEVTNKQYSSFLNKALQNGDIYISHGDVICAKDSSRLLFKTVDAVPFSEIKFKNNKFKVVTGRENFPVVFVTYYGAKKYASYKGDRLPTEAEWEYAASWNGKRKYQYAISRNSVKYSKINLEDSGDPFENSEVIKSTPVGFYNASSPYGCKDMSGNVWEWCSDFYSSQIHKNEMKSVVKDPPGPENGTMKVIKGGAWNTEGSVVTTTKRLGINPNNALINLGFRCVKVNK